MAKGASFFGVILVAAGVLLAYLYSSGKWPAVWSAITGASPVAKTASTGSPPTGAGQKGSISVPVPGGTVNGKGSIILAIEPNQSNGTQVLAGQTLNLATLQPYPAVNYSYGFN